MLPKKVDKKSKTLFYGKLEGVVHGTNMIMGPHFPLLVLYTYCNLVLSLLLFSAFPYSGWTQRESLLHKTRSISSPSLAPTISMHSLTKSIHLFFGLPLFHLPGFAISYDLSHSYPNVTFFSLLHASIPT